MSFKTFDRYGFFREEGQIRMVPFIKIDKKPSDYYEQYILGRTRLDVLSNKYYGNPNYDWLIMQANPELGSMEFEIPNYSDIRIPYPLDITLQEYIMRLKEYNEVNYL